MRFSRFLIYPLILLVAALPAHAILTVQAAAVDATNPSNFLLAAEAANGDPAFDRESVNARFQVQLFNANAVFADEIEVEVTFSLLNQVTGLPVDLASGGNSIVQTQLFNLAAQQQQIEVMDAALEPAAMLDPAVNHRVVASVRYRAHSGVWSAPVLYHGSWRKWVHFMNTTADDDSLNLKAVAGSLAVANAQILKSVAGQEQFIASLGMKLHRYDIESVPQPAADVPVKIDLRLYDSMSLDEVTLANPSLTIFRPMLGRSATNPPDPVTDVWTQELTFAPAPGAVVNPTADYVLEVTVSTLEPDNTPVPSVPPLQTSSARRFLVLSGKLWFGGVETTFTQLANDPSPPMALTPPDAYATQLAVTEGSAQAAPGRRYGNGDLLSVSYDPVSGDVTVTSGTQSLETTASDIVTLGGLRFVRGVMRLDPAARCLKVVV